MNTSEELRWALVRLAQLRDYAASEQGRADECKAGVEATEEWRLYEEARQAAIDRDLSDLLKET